MDHSPRFALPFLAPGQAQKEFFHNEALQRIDFLLCPVIEEPPRQAPPASPVIGQAYVVATGATGVWAGHDGEIAGFGEGGWRFVAAIDGMSVIDRSSGETLLRRSGSWEPGVVRAREVRVNAQKVIGARQGAIAAPTGGATIDAEGRSAIAAILLAMRSHGLIEL